MSDCILHQLSVNKSSGYGQVGYKGVKWQAHRLAYTLAHGEIPAGMQVHHKCDNKLCVNPEHLWLGTQKENLADMRAKGRQVSAEAHSRTMQKVAARGFDNAATKLSEAQVAEIRALYGTGRVSQYALSRQFGVSQPHISDIVRGRKRR